VTGSGVSWANRAWTWLEATFFLALSLLLRAPHLEHAGFYDEFYHTLAARSLLEVGSLASEAFTYQRAAVFSWGVAGSFAVFGESLAAARLPALVAGCLLVLAVWATGRRVAGVWAGRVAGLLLAFDPEAIFLSQISRFYSLQALAVLAGGAALYAAIDPRAKSAATRAALGTASAALLALAFRLNLTTAIAVAAFALWAVVDLAPASLRAWQGSRRVRRLAPVALLLVVVAAAFLLPDPAWLFGHYLGAATYARDLQFDFGFYLRFLGGHVPVLCALAPLMALFALRSQPRLASCLIVVFTIALVLHSGAGRKEERYFFWALPLLHLLLGVGAAAAREPSLALARDALAGVFGTGRAVRAIAVPLVTAMAIVAVAMNPSYRVTLGMLATPTEQWPGPYHRHQPAQWGEAAPRLEALLEGRCALVSSAGVKALHYLRRLDYDLLRTLRDEHTPDHLAEFVMDHRTHRPTISEITSMEEVLRRHPSGLVVVDEVHWARDAYVSEEVAAYLEEMLERVEVPEAWRMHVFSWGAPGSSAAGCSPR
jgi:hypothetical protein